MRTSGRSHGISRTGSTLAVVGAAAALLAATAGYSMPSSAEDGYGRPGQQMKVPTIDLETATIRELSELFADGKISAVRLGGLFLDRIYALNTDGPGINAVRSINPEWKKEAAYIDRLRAQGKDLGPMMGMPILLKDNIDVAGMATTAGSAALQHNIATKDAPIVTELRAAGAIILGKANLSEFAYWLTEGAPSGYSSIAGQVLNPYDTSVTPGGSSSGSGAAIAVGMAAGTVGSDTGGSITSPSNAASSVGLRPTVGLLSRSGVVPISSTNDTTGPMTHTVWDAAAMLTAMTTGVDGGDSATGDAGEFDDFDYTEALSDTSLEGARLGYIAPAQADPIYEAALQTMRDQGATLVPVAIDQSQVPDRTVWDWEFKKDLNAYLSKTSEQNPVRSLADVIAYNKAHADIALKFGQTLAEKAQAVNLDDPAEVASYEQMRDERLAIARGLIDDTLTEHDLTAIVYPGQSGNTVVTSAAYPTIVLPAGYQPANRRPVGVQLIGTKYSDATLLSYAYDYEQARPNLQKPPSELNPTLFRCVENPDAATCAP